MKDIAGEVLSAQTKPLKVVAREWGPFGYCRNDYGTCVYYCVALRVFGSILSVGLTTASRE